MAALSTTEVEYIALSLAAQDAIWLQKLLMELKVPSQPITLMEDNQGAIVLTKNPVAHSRTKHINIRFHFVCEALEKDVIKIKYCPTEEMVADLLTKPLPKGTFEKLRSLLGMETMLFKL